MPQAHAHAAYGSEPRPTRNAIPAPPAPVGLAGLEEFARLLARAVQQFRVYPPTNPRCADAVANCHRSLAAQPERGRILFRVHPRELLIDEWRFGGGTIIEHELVRRLHRAHVGALSVDCAASPRDLTRFCRELLDTLDRGDTPTTLADALSERGVDKIVPIMTRRPEVFDVGTPNAERHTLITLERERRASTRAADGAESYLYPPDRGFIRLDPTARLNTVSLADLAVLVDDPRDLASMLMRMTDDAAPGDTGRDAALEQKFSDVATLFSALSPRLARLMFSRLASAVLALDHDRRSALLKRTVLPGLLDGRADGAVLRDFPDVDLAESLCLLLDLETAAPEVLTTALDRLDLTEDRRLAMAPLLEERLHRREQGAGGRRAAAEDGVERHTRRLVRVEAGTEKSFADFIGFDLAMDAEGDAVLDALRQTIAATDPIAARLRCLWQLVRLEPNPTLVETFLRRALGLLAELEHALRWQDLSTWLVQYRALGETLQDGRPDVAAAVADALTGFFTRDRILRLRELYDADTKSQTVAGTLVRAAGPGIADSFVAALATGVSGTDVRTLTQLMCDHGPLLAPRLAEQLGRWPGDTTRVLIKVIGYAGAGYERVLAGLLTQDDEPVVREALRALTRLGTAEAAATVALRIQEGTPATRRAAEEALWHFPQAYAHEQVRRLLARQDFVRRCPREATRLLERAARSGAAGLGPILAGLRPLRFRLWNPGQAHLGRTARALATP